MNIEKHSTGWIKPIYEQMILLFYYFYYFISTNPDNTDVIIWLRKWF